MDHHFYHVLIVDDRQDMIDAVRRELNDVLIDGNYPNLQMQSCASFSEAEELLKNGDFDLAILDVREEARGQERPDNSRGTRAFDAVRSLKFLPVVFFTALPEMAKSYEARPLISVVAKDDLEKLPQAVQEALQSGVSTTVRSINSHVDKVIRNYLWSTVAPAWEQVSGNSPEQLAELLVARVTRSLSENAMIELREELSVAGAEGAEGAESEEIPNAATYYVYPPVNDLLVPGP